MEHKDKMAMLATVGAVSSVLSLIFVLFAKNRVTAAGDFVKFMAHDFFQPAAAKDLAASLDTGDEDETIIAAWDWVGREIAYEAIGSDIDFDGEYITCLHCFTVEETLRRRQGNCVSKSALLGSILANYLPPNDVRLVIGGFSMDGVGGHCWVEIRRLGTWYLVEATSPPRNVNWVPVGSMSTVYIPYAVISMEDFQCRDRNFCFEVGACNCQQRIPELL